MGEFSDLIGIRKEYFEYTDEIVELIKSETTAINEAYLGDSLIDKLMKCLENEYPLTNMIILRITLNEIINLITDSTFVNVRRDISNKIVTRVTGKSAIMAYYSKNSDDIKKRRAMMKMIENYMQSMYLSGIKSDISMMEDGIKKALQKFQDEETAIKTIEVSSFDSGNPTQGLVFTITINIDQKDS